MTFKKNKMISQSKITAQSIVEYIVLFIVLACGILVSFRSFNPDSLRIRRNFEEGLNSTINKINNW